MPVPLMVSVLPTVGVKLKASAPATKSIVLTSISILLWRDVVFEVSKVATSVELFGTVAGTQLLLPAQSAFTGAVLQVALPATAKSALNNKPNVPAKSAAV